MLGFDVRRDQPPGGEDAGWPGGGFGVTVVPLGGGGFAISVGADGGAAGFGGFAVSLGAEGGWE